MEIKVANEAKQDVGIAKANEILNKINNQQITAQCVKSVQRGFCYNQTGTVNNNKEIKVVSLSNINVAKSQFSYIYRGYTTVGGSGVVEIAFGLEGTSLTLKSDGIYLNWVTTEIYPDFNVNPFEWQVIEFY